jgi:hypothetical protein
VFRHLLGAKAMSLGVTSGGAADKPIGVRPRPHALAGPLTPARSSERDSNREPISDRDEPAKRFDPLDPATRHAAQLGLPVSSTPAPLAVTEEIAPRARVSMEELLPQLVKRIAWAGDRRRGTVQLELGAGRHAGTTVTVHADGGRVRIELQGKGDVEELRSRIDARLRRHGLDVESVT